jgi:branched-chain amino acid transport system permease protein
MDCSAFRAAPCWALVLALAAIWALQRLMELPFGQVLLAVRDNEARAVSLGYDVRAYKLAAFVISAAVSGLAGGLKALMLGLASLNDVHWMQSGSIILMCLLGGLGTPLGPVVGAVLVVALESRLSDVGAVHVGPLSIDLSTKVPIVIGLIFMACVLAFRRGIVGEILAARAKGDK